jgi:hypothetical protein
MHQRAHKSDGRKRKMPQRLPQPALGRGRCQLGARRAAYALGNVISTSDAALFCYPQRLLMSGLKLEPHHYRLIRRAMSRVAVCVGRGAGRGRPMLWLLNDGLDYGQE